MNKTVISQETAERLEALIKSLPGEELHRAELVRAVIASLEGPHAEKLTLAFLETFRRHSPTH